MYPLNANVVGECEAAEEVVTSESEEYLYPLRYKNSQFSNVSSESNMTALGQSISLPADDNNLHNGNMIGGKIEIPIVGYEIMEERARFTVYKLRIENKESDNCWYVFRRYTDFVRLCNRLRNRYPELLQHLPRKRWLKNNFDPIFLEERINGLQTLINAILSVPDILEVEEIQDFFCLNEPPVYSETNEESRALLEAMEETVHSLKQQLLERDNLIDSLQADLHVKTIENDNLKKLIRNSSTDCCKCKKDYENLNQLIK